MYNDLRKQVKFLKCFHNVSYKEIADLLEISQGAIYNWLSGAYELSYNKQQQLKQIINQLKEC